MTDKEFLKLHNSVIEGGVFMAMDALANLINSLKDAVGDNSVHAALMDCCQLASDLVAIAKGQYPKEEE